MRLRLEETLALTLFLFCEVEMADIVNMSEQEVYGNGVHALFGRRQIWCTTDELTEDNIVAEVNSALSIHIQNLLEMEYLYWYRRGLQPILNRKKEIRPEINNRIAENHADEIVNFKDGYFLTKPAFYVARNDEEDINEDVKELNEYLYRSGKQDADNSVVDWFHTVGRGVLYITPNDDNETPALAYALDPRSAFVCYDLTPSHSPKLACNIVVNNGELSVDAYTKDTVYRLKGTTIGRFMTNDPTFVATVTELVGTEPNVLKDIPIIEYQYNSVWMGAFESALPLLDAINTTMSNRIDGIEQFIQSLAIAVNCDLDEDVTANKIRQAGMIVLKSIGENKADFKILSEQLNQSETQVLVDYLYQQVMTICGMPNSYASRYGRADTQSAQLAKDGWYQADTVARNTEDLFIRSNKKFDKIFLDILRRKNLTKLKPSDIKLQFSRNETSNVQSKAQAMYTLLGAGLAPELAFAKSGISNDPVSDVALSRKYLNLVWGDPDAPIVKTVEGATVMNPEANTPSGEIPAMKDFPEQAVNGDPEQVHKALGEHYVKGYWKSN